MATRFFCDDCGTELIMPWRMEASTNNIKMLSYSNTDGIKYYDNQTDSWLDLCNECKMKRIIKSEVNHEGS